MAGPVYSPLLTPPSDHLLLVGAGRNANNLIEIFESVGVRISGIVDDRPQEAVLGHDVETIDSVDGAAFEAFLTIANPEDARRIRDRPALRACRWPYFVYPQSVVGAHAEIGEGCYIGPFSTMTNVKLGRHVHVFTHDGIGARAEIGDFSIILPHVMIGSDVRIGTDCVIGMGARIYAGVTIGDHCRVGPNAVIHHDMPAGSIALPTPARIRSRAKFARRLNAEGA